MTDSSSVFNGSYAKRSAFTQQSLAPPLETGARTVTKSVVHVASECGPAHAPIRQFLNTADATTLHRSTRSCMHLASHSQLL